MRTIVTYKLDKIILETLNIKDYFYSDYTLGVEINKKWKGAKKNTIILSYELKKILNYQNNIELPHIYDVIDRIKLNHIYTTNPPPNCSFYSYDQKPIY